MTRRRAHISLKTKLAAALCQMLRANEHGEFVPVISHDQSRQMTADEIIAVFHFDHYPIPHAEDGPDEPWNLTPRPKAEHMKRTAEVDVPRIAKNKRVSRRSTEHQAVMAAKGCGEDKPLPAKQKQKIRSRPLRGGRRFQTRVSA